MRKIGFTTKSLPLYLLALCLAAAPLAGCAEPPSEELIAAQQSIQQLTGELNRAKQQNEQLAKEQTQNDALIKQAHADSQSHASEVVRLKSENAQLTKKQDEMENEIAELKTQLRDAMKANFALLNPADQKSLLGHLEKFKSGEALDPSGVQALIDTGLIQRDDPRYLEFKKSR